MFRSLKRVAVATLMVTPLLGLGACVGNAASGPVDPSAPVAGYGYSCKAGIYSCKLPTKVPLATPCSCPGIGAASYGNVHQP
ncbi:hypothetical protein D5366_01900 [Neokomagataea tanensis]|uniref:Lipoprotein n=1 Tax=Neokomagataea tanensis TaxID=661191 RepID=A0A4Y6V4F5_9PROT|nr:MULTISPECIES: hypothetical protein [Neokomagataea]QDH24224.1 hypothetical protein D5366_01900 [Neokomagataea tanensis]